MAHNIANKKTCIPYFWIPYLFVWKTHLRSTNSLAVKWLLLYIYVPIYREVWGGVSTEPLIILQNKKICISYSWILYPFVWKTHLRSSNRVDVKWLLSYIHTYIYREVRGCMSTEPLTILQNKKKHVYPILDSFCVKDP